MIYKGGNFTGLNKLISLYALIRNSVVSIWSSAQRDFLKYIVKESVGWCSWWEMETGGDRRKSIDLIKVQGE